MIERYELLVPKIVNTRIALVSVQQDIGTVVVARRAEIDFTSRDGVFRHIDTFGNRVYLFGHVVEGIADALEVVGNDLRGNAKHFTTSSSAVVG